MGDDDLQRELFEAWAKEWGYELKTLSPGGTYCSNLTRKLYEAYCAGELVGTLNYQGAMDEIGRINEVARNNPDNLVDYLKANYPKDWGLTPEQHLAHIQKGSNNG